MMVPPDVRITSAVLWPGVLIAVPIDVAFVCILTWRIKDATFHRLKWPIAEKMAIFFSALWACVACYLANGQLSTGQGAPIGMRLPTCRLSFALAEMRKKTRIPFGAVSLSLR